MNYPIGPVLIVSLKVALVATAVVMISSVFLALVFVESRSKLIKAFELLIYLPMAVPPVALGYGLLLALGRNSFLGRLFHQFIGIDISFTIIGAIVAACAVSLGIGVRTIKVALERIDQQQVNIARLLGASQAQILWHIVLPQCVHAIAGGAVLVFMRTMAEFGATMILAGNTLGETRTLALAIWVGMEVPGQERECLMLVVIAVIISLIALLSAEILLRHRG